MGRLRPWRRGSLHLALEDISPHLIPLLKVKFPALPFSNVLGAREMVDTGRTYPPGVWDLICVPESRCKMTSTVGFPGGSAGKEPACNVGDLGSIPALGTAPGEGKGCHSSILAWRIPWTIQGGPWGRKESDTTE